jgi:hypothetical protein
MALYCAFKYSQMKDERGVLCFKTLVISSSLYSYWACDVTWAQFVFTRFNCEIHLIVQHPISVTIPALWDMRFIQRASENIIKLYIPSPNYSAAFYYTYRRRIKNENLDHVLIIDTDFWRFFQANKLSLSTFLRHHHRTYLQSCVKMEVLSYDTMQPATREQKLRGNYCAELHFYSAIGDNIFLEATATLHCLITQETAICNLPARKPQIS